MFLEKKIKKTNKNGITYYEFPSYTNKNVQDIFGQISSSYPECKIISTVDDNVINKPIKHEEKIVYIVYDIITQMVKNVIYFP
jgi:hypothetical protein